MDHIREALLIQENIDDNSIMDEHNTTSNSALLYPSGHATNQSEFVPSESLIPSNHVTETYGYTFQGPDNNGATSLHQMTPSQVCLTNHKCITRNVQSIEQSKQICAKENPVTPFSLDIEHGKNNYMGHITQPSHGQSYHKDYGEMNGKKKSCNTTHYAQPHEPTTVRCTFQNKKTCKQTSIIQISDHRPEENKTYDTECYTCGACESKFNMICELHYHLLSHFSTGSYTFNVNTRTAYPKFDGISRAVQTSDIGIIDEGSREFDMSPQEDILDGKDKVSDQTDFNTTAEGIDDKSRIKRCSKRLKRKHYRKRYSDNCIEEQGKKKLKSKNSNGILSNESDELFDTSQGLETTTSHDTDSNSVSNQFSLHEKIRKDKNSDPEYMINDSSKDRTDESDADTNSHYSDYESENEDKNIRSKTSIVKGNKTHCHSCEECGKKYRFESGLNKHRKDRHSVQLDEDETRNISFKCKWCHEMFELKTKLISHVKICSKNDGLKCYICDAIFPCKADRLKHSECHENLSDLTCKICGKRVQSLSIMQTHMKGHHKPKTIQCDQCGISFHYKHLLKKHMVYCNNERPISCTKCDMKFKTIYAMKRHFSIHTEEKPYVCHICGFAGKKLDYLKRHIRVHTGERPFQCKICGLGFRGGPGLNRHKKIHSNSKQSVCQYCGKTFTNNWNLKTHVRQHTGDTPYKCKECGMAFKQNVLVKLHMKSHHPYV